MIVRPPIPPVPTVPQPMPGNGTLLTVRGTQFAYNAAPQGPSWAHPFRASLSGDGVRIGDGRVNGIMPMIEQKRMVEAVLILSGAGVQPVNGESWVCVEATPNGDGAIDPSQEGALVIVHRSEPLTQTAETGRHPIALIAWAGNQPRFLTQHTFFNLRYQRIQTGTRVDHDFK